MAGRLEGEAEDPVETHEINVTPFIDVMLVLLIVFMVAAPLASVDVPVDLPTASTQPQPRESEPLFVTLGADLSLRIGEAPVTLAALPAALESASGGDRERRVHLRADRAVAYGKLMEVMDRLRNAGYGQLALVALEAGPPS